MLPAYKRLRGRGGRAGWYQAEHEAVATEQEVTISFSVKEQGGDEIRRVATEVSDPTSPKYGQYLTQRQIDEIVAPKSEDVQAVTSWLAANGVGYQRKGVSTIEARTTVGKAGELLQTNFHVARHDADNYAVVQAGDYVLPSAIHNAVAAVFGLHGLPIPRNILAPPHMPANVTPAVIYSTYGVDFKEASRSDKNTQAVAEFQGQFMNSTDLATMFAQEVSQIDANYKVGTDDVVSKWVGKHIENSGGVEAELDIQFIMGVSPGIKTEFWEFPGQDFCGDLNMWTGNLTSGDDCPLVHSVSYGWQGNLTQIQCKDENVDAVDGNFAKLAAKGISIMISSGDSGSGYSPNNACGMNPGQKGVGIDGTIARAIEAQEVGQCCEEASQMKAKGWTFVPHQKPDTVEAEADPGAFSFKDTVYHAIVEGIIKPGGSNPFKSRDVFVLNGDLTKDGGSVTAKNLNGTVADTTLTFGPEEKNQGIESLRNVTGTFGSATLTGRAVFVAMPGTPARCFNIEWMGKDGITIWEQGPNPPPPPPPGLCTLYADVQSHTTANDSTVSDFAKKEKVVLWPSWPASSPWVTSVGATRFVGQQAGNEEMATDQFGSGGGFSSQFDQSNAGYQTEATANYLKTVDPSTLPPADSFPATGRGTPDVSALGEGFQVYVGGRPMGVGGTSASSPTFAGLVSLLNEARLTGGKPAMGFLNPFLYKNSDAFFDVVKGSNKVGRGGEPLPYGWNCSKGWDPATGLGTPLFKKLMAAAMGSDGN